MSQINDGGPAFPWGEHGTHLGGMTLRDYFAARAAQGEIAASSNGAQSPRPEAVARYAYEVADAMIAAREKGGAA